MQELCLEKLGNRRLGESQQDPGIREKDGATVGDVVEWVEPSPWEPGRARPGYAGTSVGDPDSHVFRAYRIQLRILHFSHKRI